MTAYRSLENGLVTPREENWPALEQLRVDIVKGNLNGVRKSIQQGLSPDQVLRGSWSPLMYACSLGHQDVAEFLLKAGANPNFHKDQFTSLMAACTSGRDERNLLECVKLLLLHGANIDAGDHVNVTSLMFASREGHLLIVEYLIKKRADMYLRDNQGWTALFWAIDSKRTPVMKYLLKEESLDYMSNCKVVPKHVTYKRKREIFNLMNGEIHHGNDTDSTESDEKMHLHCNGDLLKHDKNNHDDCLKMISELEINLYHDYSALSQVRCQLRDDAVNKPVLGRHLCNKIREALRASECVYYQMQFLYHFVAKVADPNEIIPADFVVEKKVVLSTQSWSTIIITSLVVGITLWKSSPSLRLPSLTSSFGVLFS